MQNYWLGIITGLVTALIVVCTVLIAMHVINPEEEE